MSSFVNSPAINEPFSTGRSASRLLFDFSVMLNCVKDIPENNRILDFACGTGWVAEFLSRSGYCVYGFDISSDVVSLAKNRLDADQRLSKENLSFFVSDGHLLNSIEDSFFSNIICFDSLHHMHDFERVLSEMSRVLTSGGRAVFVEPGSKHSTSQETMDFMQKYKKDDPTWIERDIVLEEINSIAKRNNFSSLKVKPFLFPEMVEYEFKDWINFKENKIAQEQLINQLRDFNYGSRVIFYIDKL